MKPKYQGKSILVAGASGFIGSHLTERLLEEGCHVTAIDNYVTGNSKNLEAAKSRFQEKLEILKADISESNWQDKLTRNYDAVLNLASPASPIDFPLIPIEILRTSSLGTENLLKLAKNCAARFLQASTSEVYGDPLEHPQKESYYGNVNSIGVRSCYDEGKRYAEALIMAYRRVHDVNTGMFRIFNTYGPRMRLNDGRVVPQFGVQCLKGEPITIHGDGLQTRSFCYVSDLVEGIWRLLNTDYDLPVNLGMPKENTVKELAEVLIELTGAKSKLTFKPLPQDDPKKRLPDISRAREILNWEPKIALKDGLTKTLEAFRAEISV